MAPPTIGGSRFVLRIQKAPLALAMLGWLCVGLVTGAYQPRSDELLDDFRVCRSRHVCVVIETPDGRVLLYDAGALSGPDVTVQIAPDLWLCGISRIERRSLIFLARRSRSFQRPAGACRRFTIGRIAITPKSFEQKNWPLGVRAALESARARYGRSVPVTRILLAMSP